MSSTRITFRDAVEEGLRMEMHRDQSVVAVVAGEDGDAAGATDGFDRLFGDRLVRLEAPADTLLGTAGGVAAAGLRAICAVPLTELGPRALAQLATAGSLHAEGAEMPLLVRVGVRDDGAARAGIESLLALPGVTVVAPSNPADAKGLVVSAIRSGGPVCLLEEQSLLAVPGDVPEGGHEVPIGEACVLRAGGSLSLLAHGSAVRIAELAAEELDSPIEVVDLRTLRPLDEATVIESAKRNGRVILVEATDHDSSPAAEVAALLWESAFEYLDAPLRRVRLGALDAAALSPNGKKPAALRRLEKACRDLLDY